MPEFPAEPEAKPARKFDLMTILPMAVMAVTTLIMIAAMVFGAEILGVDGQDGVAEILSTVRDSPWAAVFVIGVFTLLGLTGFPQFLLIGGTVAIFGPLGGFIYSWIATMVSALVGFWIGRLSGGSVLRRYGGATIQRASEMLGQRGIAASFIVRLVPSGPFVVVNMVAGLSHITLAQFLIGSGLGIIPKTAVIAFLGGRLLEFLKHQDPIEIAIFAAVLLAWIGLGLWVRRRFLSSARKASGPVPATGEAQTALAVASQEDEKKR